MLSLRGKEFPNFEDRIFLITLESAYKNFVSSKEKLLKGIHPPLVDSSYKVNENQEIDCSPFSRIDKQQNFTNLSLHTIGQQLSRVENQVQNF